MTWGALQQQLLFSSSVRQWSLPWHQALGSAGCLGAVHGHRPGAAYLLAGRHGLVRAIGGAGKIASHFGAGCFPLGGLVVTGWFSGEVTLFPRGCCVSVQQRQQGAAGSSRGIAVLWMGNCNEKAHGVKGCAVHTAAPITREEMGKLERASKKH